MQKWTLTPHCLIRGLRVFPTILKWCDHCSLPSCKKFETCSDDFQDVQKPYSSELNALPELRLFLIFAVSLFYFIDKQSFRKNNMRSLIRLRLREIQNKILSLLFLIQNFMFFRVVQFKALGTFSTKKSLKNRMVKQKRVKLDNFWSM